MKVMERVFVFRGINFGSGGFTVMNTRYIVSVGKYGTGVIRVK